MYSYSQQSWYFWNRHKFAWACRPEPSSDRTVPTTAVYSVMELMYQVIWSAQYIDGRVTETEEWRLTFCSVCVAERICDSISPELRSSIKNIPSPYNCRYYRQVLIHSHCNTPSFAFLFSAQVSSWLLARDIPAVLILVKSGSSNGVGRPFKQMYYRKTLVVHLPSPGKTVISY